MPFSIVDSRAGYDARESRSDSNAKPGATHYGVELGGPADASRLQIKVVGAEVPLMPRSSQRDTEQEQLWCSEVDDPVASLNRSGTEVTIKRALAVGAQPLKSKVGVPATPEPTRFLH